MARTHHQHQGAKVVRWSLFLALNWRLVNIIVAAARFAYSHLKTAGEGAQLSNLPSGCEAIW